jgi:hypothetical protein
MRSVVAKIVGLGHGRRAFRNPRIWSNRELAKFAGMFSGDVVNVSAWRDEDKEGRLYKSYFTQASGYYTTNFGTEQGTLTPSATEQFLDLEQPLPAELAQRYAVVFNHTVLEHVYDFQSAFRNLCDLSSDIVIVILPWLQEMHTNYGDYWRFSPQAVSRLFADNGFTTLHLSWSDAVNSSVYVFAIASRRPEAWISRFQPPAPPSSEAFTTLPRDNPGRYALSAGFGSWADRLLRTVAKRLNS